MNNPDKESLNNFLMRNESMRRLDLELSTTDKITQEFLRKALQTIIDAYMDIEYKQIFCQSNLDIAIDKANLAKKCTELFMQDVIANRTNT